MLLLAHRGASADAPENTLEAFAEAARQGADGVELDAMVCGSGEVVVCHDERLERLARLPWEVRHTPWWKLQRADVGTSLGFAPARIPLLEDVLDALPPQLIVNIELKCDRFDDDGLSQKVADLVRRRGLAERVVVSSFNPLCLFRLLAVAPELRRGYLIDPDRRWGVHAYAVSPLVSSHSVHPYYEDCTPERVATWRAAGLRVATWTVDDAARARALEQMGVSYLITNRPGALREALRAAA
ncbi:glycerophosphodiester phosphodiesterase [Myxococcus sp. CA051A]|uniref:Glycerophosphodiester phosphodiesterase n=1 Tax=Myxococcus llanfairpwllgwyngyllgogerychwyrndrobwllllantysiliogogogochensis TaxID=2590453 RepID=A0A540WWL4_9BACT|nr:MULTISPECIES: glycerophosphodiester phosphodiesterase family protein [Myxococcus]NTX00559.1 glycerophosphodiester phosphodiesterase [Myxococcus sp. CA040A]NTX12738.1 glycerophosphodiester phosphodiesterase [Myxococcus sp. CA056]NTX59136.1 glycerophosphodiester phosphodiesterase [Myxococcus sp. CA051A]TQF13382.1 glycerophosphodiester phosphodiesterase [Myxococcus llanfairpwllgwyngyllgogerychwyrndrobwllllantysiliogogogochensis]